MTSVNGRARAVAAAHQGLLTRAQALDAGMSPTDLRHAMRQRDLVVVRRGVYALGEIWESLDEHRGRPRLRTRAATRTMSRDWVISHDSAAVEHGLAVLSVPEPQVHVTRPGFTGAWTKTGVKHHLARFTPAQVVQVDDVKPLDLARTSVDIAREHGAPYGEVACDAALRRGVPRSRLEDAVEVMTNWAHVRRTRAAIQFADAGAESPVETLGRLLVSELGLAAELETQFPVRLGDRVVWVDIRVGCHLFECDGKPKYVPVADGGLAASSPTEVVWAEKKRERELHREGLGTSRIFFEDYWGDRHRAALARMRAEYDETVARFGDRLPAHLAQNARELRGRRRA